MKNESEFYAYSMNESKIFVFYLCVENIARKE